MYIITFRTDKPEAELGLFQDDKCLEHVTWHAHRMLAETLHIKLKDLLNKNGIELTDIDGLIYYEGPGSFTGLRISASVVNALASTLKIPVIQSRGADWINLGISKLLTGKNNQIVTPVYGQPVNITIQKK